MNLHRTAEVILWCLITGLLAFALGSCGRDGVKADRDTAYKLANHYRWQRDSTMAAQAKTDTVTRTVIRADRRVLAERDSLISVLTYADSVLQDSTASLVTLRVTLGITISRARTYQVAVDSLQGVARDLVAAHALERVATTKTLMLADSTIASWKRVADAERKQGWRRFTQGAFVGGIVVIVAVLTL